MDLQNVSLVSPQFCFPSGKMPVFPDGDRKIGCAVREISCFSGWDVLRSSFVAKIHSVRCPYWNSLMRPVACIPFTITISIPMRMGKWFAKLMNIFSMLKGAHHFTLEHLDV